MDNESEECPSQVENENISVNVSSGNVVFSTSKQVKTMHIHSLKLLYNSSTCHLQILHTIIDYCIYYCCILTPYKLHYFSCISYKEIQRFLVNQFLR